MRQIVVLTILAVSLSGCAVKRFGKVKPVSQSERVSLSCGAILAEQRKIDEFEAKMQKRSKVGVLSAVGFVSDFGVGNAMSKGRAKKSVARRRGELNALYAQKGCGTARTYAPAPPPRASAKPAPRPRKTRR